MSGPAGRVVPALGRGSITVRRALPRAPLALLAALVAGLATVLVVEGEPPRLAVAGAAVGVIALGAAARGSRQPGLGLGAVGAGLALAVGPATTLLLAAVVGAAGGGLLATYLDGIERRRERLRSLVAGVAVGLAGALAAVATTTSGRALGLETTALWLLAAALASAGGLGAAVVLQRAPPPLVAVAQTAREALAWLAGGLVGGLLGAPAALSASGPLGVAVLIGFAAAAAAEVAAARRALTLERRRARELERLSRAGERLSRGPSDLEDAVASVWQELRHAVAVEWFHLEVVAPGREGPEWAGDPEGRLVPGAPQPPAYPTPLPGIHRRAAWRRLEYELEAEARPLAVVRLWCDPRRLGPEGLVTVERLVPQLGARLHRGVLGREAREDPLTGAALRRVFERRLVELFERAIEGGGSLAVALVDLDFFKRINDVYGHTAGDQALIHASTVLRSRLRDGDLCARWGGEEFALVFDGLDATEGLAIVERLRAELAGLPIWFEGERLPVTMSGGVAAFPGLFVSSGKELIELADRALYAAKSTGRNRTLSFLGPGRYGTPEGEEISDGEPVQRQMPRLFV